MKKIKENKEETVQGIDTDNTSLNRFPIAQELIVKITKLIKETIIEWNNIWQVGRNLLTSYSAKRGLIYRIINDLNIWHQKKEKSSE